MSELSIPEHLTNRPLRVAIVGAGPAGIYAADMLAKSEAVSSGALQLKVDLFDELPTPFGLIRYGVSPDHPRIKASSPPCTRCCTTTGSTSTATWAWGGTSPWMNSRPATTR